MASKEIPGSAQDEQLVARDIPTPWFEQEAEESTAGRWPVLVSESRMARRGPYQLAMGLMPRRAAESTETDSEGI